MALLNTADDIKYGVNQVDRVYRGSTLVWMNTIPMHVQLTAERTQINTGDAVTLVANLVPDVPPPVAIRSVSGVVNFREGSPTGPIIAQDVTAPWSTTVNPSADTTYYAEYLGADPYLPAMSGPLSINVAAVASVSLTADKTSVAQGTSATLTATVAGVTTGTINFRTGSPTGPIVATDTSSPWTYIVTPTGDVTYYAEYVGNPEFMGAVSNALSIDYYIPTTVNLSASKTSVNQGETTTLTATVPGVAVGTVNFRAGSPTGSIVASDPSAPWSAVVTPTADTTYFAEYVGAAEYASNVSSGVAVNFSIPTSTSISANPTAVEVGSPTTLTATVSGASTGTVRFRSGSASGTVVATVNAPPWTASVTPPGDTTYFAEYVANGDYLGSTSSGVTVTRKVTTSISIAASATDITSGTAVTLTATVAGAPSGTVLFRQDGTGLAYVAGPPYQLSVTPGAGWSNYYADYVASGVYLGSSSGAVSVYTRTLTTHTWSGYATWAQCYNGSGNQKSGDYYYGWYSTNQGNQRSMFHFDLPDFTGVVAVTGVRIKFYNVHAFLNSGGSIPTGLHCNDTKPNTWTCAWENLQTLGNAPKPGWVDAWMGDNFKNTIKNNSNVKGFVLGPGPTNEQKYYGYANGDSPYMEVQYQVWE